MSTASASPKPTAGTPTPASDPNPGLEARLGTPAHQAFHVLRLAFVVAPIVFGLDKFTNLLTDWTGYLAPWIADLSPMSPQVTMYVVGVIEIAAGALVLLRPRLGALVVALWLAGIILNLLTFSGFYDVALRDFGLLLAAVALQRLATTFDPHRLPWDRH